MMFLVKDRRPNFLKIPKSFGPRHARRLVAVGVYSVVAALVIEVVLALPANAVQFRPRSRSLSGHNLREISGHYKHDEPTTALRAAVKGIVTFGILRRDDKGRPTGIRSGGSGSCIDNPCTEFYTDYHVVWDLLSLKQSITVFGTDAVASVKWVGTGPDDQNAVDMLDARGISVANGNYDHDVAVMQLDKPLPLPKEFTGIKFGAEPRLFQEAWITSSPTSNLIKGEVLSTHQGLGDMPHDFFILSVGCKPGHSGLPVFNEDGEVMGFVSSSGEMTDGRQVTLVIPVSDIEQVTRKHDAKLWEKLFVRKSPKQLHRFTSLQI